MRRVAWRLVAFRALGWSLGLPIAALILFLPFAGRFLDHDDPLQKADLIFVLAGERVERWLEAIDLFREGWAPRIVISPGMRIPFGERLQAEGISYPREGELARRAMIAAGIPAAAVALLDESVDNTAHEAAALRRALPPDWRGRLVVVTSRYHTRRTGFAFRRAFRGTPVQVLIRGSRYSEIHPGRWWMHRADARYVIYELPKLVAYAAGVGE